MMIPNTTTIFLLCLIADQFFTKTSLKNVNKTVSVLIMLAISVFGLYLFCKVGKMPKKNLENDAFAKQPHPLRGK
jgi:hypothetical protein